MAKILKCTEMGINYRLWSIIIGTLLLLTVYNVILSLKIIYTQECPMDHTIQNVLQIDSKKCNQDIQYPRDETFSNLNLYLGHWDNQHKYKLFDNFIVGKNYSILSDLYKTCLATQGSIEKLFSLIEVANHWNGPISLATFAASEEELNALLLYILYLRKCNQKIIDNVSFHLALAKERIPEKFYIDKQKLKELKCDNPTKVAQHLSKNLQPKIRASKEIKVIYLYNNNIKLIENLNGNIFPNLTSLYLQNNQIQKIESLVFKKLRKLYIGYNQIAVIEGLEKLFTLEELHVEKQTLPDGMGLCFDPRSTINLSRTLRVLNISNNKIPAFSSLSFLQELQSIDASHCDLEDLQEVCDTLKGWKYLTKAYFYGNPFSKYHRYRENIIVNCYYLESLDGKDISENSREFLKRLEPRRSVSGTQPASNSYNLSELVESLPNNYPPPLQKAASAQLLKWNKYNPLNLSGDERDDTLNFMAWKGLPKRRPFVRKLNPKSTNHSESAIIVNKLS